MAERSFGRLLLEAVDEAFESLGESARRAIYFHLENRFKIARSEIPDHVEAFSDGLENIFGVGAQFLEILMMRKLHERIGQPLVWDEGRELVFASYVEEAKRSYQKKLKPK